MKRAIQQRNQMKQKYEKRARPLCISSYACIESKGGGERDKKKTIKNIIESSLCIARSLPNPFRVYILTLRYS